MHKNASFVVEVLRKHSMCFVKFWAILNLMLFIKSTTIKQVLKRYALTIAHLNICSHLNNSHRIVVRWCSPPQYRDEKHCTHYLLLYELVICSYLNQLYHLCSDDRRYPKRWVWFAMYRKCLVNIFVQLLSSLSSKKFVFSHPWNFLHSGHKENP